MSSVYASIYGFGGSLLLERQPLEGQRWPFKFLNEESIVEEASVFHPDCIVVLVILVLGLHGAN